MPDKISLERISKLHPKLRAEALLILTEIEGALKGNARFRVVSTLRTFAEQTTLYNQGRTTKGDIVTNAKAGSSFHNYALALDFALIVDKDGNGTYESTSWDTVKDFDRDAKADWMEIIAIFKRYGWKWGGDFKSIVDKPHVEKTFGYSVKQLYELHKAGKVDAKGYVLI
ncbi:M15 family metallopeptidase [Hymenobacter canadensis]|uniref:M15 family metallopeptidase n=1 Tax=Hymenobacter canadensis TaxID=2999067 RepID=A0ABY7LRX1_9BACT|nr:M15 family metallopeptidase [Hymenobacter canadensis]WBA43158.1 M15 family metallopeptidase [Hymenobacter canadensis]